MRFGYEIENWRAMADWVYNPELGYPLGFIVGP
jgi:hypothetical protein